VGPNLGRSAAFAEGQEKAIANHSKLFANLFDGFSSVQLCGIAFEFAEINGTKHNFNRDGCTAGKN
jgi:hypothetical protein